jgi:cytochrome c oxidase cbb3-type subunit 1
VGTVVARHSLGWLVAANVVGIWLALILLWPALGDALAPLSYGRWMPLHLNWHLYGWCSLPLVGALLAWCLDVRHPRVVTHAALALGAWSLALLVGGVAWLGGVTSGKLFLDWHGWSRPVLPAAMHVLWALLAAHTWWRWRDLPLGGRLARLAVLAVLLAVPTVLQWAAGRDVYPAVNPDSGGATGSALLGSTLGIVTIYLALPALLGLPARPAAGVPPSPKEAAPAGNWTWVWPLLASWAVFAVLDRGHTSHHLPSQITALAVLLAWIPLLPASWQGYAWPAAARPWLWSAAGWWALLVLSGWVTFLPGVSERLKFTHGLVAHAHLAMAGFVTGVNGAIVIALTGRAAPRGVFGAWQSGCVVMVAALLWLGAQEAGREAGLFHNESWTHVWLGLRLVGGLAMGAAAIRWLTQEVRSS